MYRMSKCQSDIGPFITLLRHATDRNFTYHQDSNIAERRATGAEICERFMTGCVDDEETRHLEFEGTIFIDYLSLCLKGIHWKVRSTYLLSDASSFTFLNVRLTDLVQ